MSQQKRRIEIDIDPIPTPVLTKLERMRDNTELDIEIRQLANFSLRIATTLNILLGAFEFGTAVITDDPPERDPSEYLS